MCSQCYIYVRRLAAPHGVYVNADTFSGSFTLCRKWFCCAAPCYAAPCGLSVNAALTTRTLGLVEYQKPSIVKHLDVGLFRAWKLDLAAKPISLSSAFRSSLGTINTVRGCIQSYHKGWFTTSKITDVPNCRCPNNIDDEKQSVTRALITI